jgi:hypothetical protein
MPGNINFGGAINTTDTVKMIQLTRFLDFCQWCPNVANGTGRGILLCSPTNPCIGVNGWMNTFNPAYALLNNNSSDINNNLIITDGNYDGRVYTGGLNDTFDFIILYPGYGFKGWTFYNYVNDGGSTTPVTFENRTGTIQWYSLATGVSSAGDNIVNYGINLNHSAPQLIPGGFVNSISSYQTYKL